jgi:hypothetical protein
MKKLEKSKKVTVLNIQKSGYSWWRGFWIQKVFINSASLVVKLIFKILSYPISYIYFLIGSEITEKGYDNPEITTPKYESVDY